MSAEVLKALQPGAGGEVPPTLEPTGVAGAQAQMPNIPDVVSILPVRSFVVFPGTVAPLNVQRSASIKLLDETLPQSKIIGLVAQRDSEKENPEPQDLYGIGTAALVLKLLRQSDDHVIAVIQGLRRFALRKIVVTHPFVRAEVQLLESVQPPQTKEF